MELHKNP